LISLLFPYTTLFRSFSATSVADYHATDIVLDSNGCAGFELHCPTGHQFIQLTIPGKHNVANALAAAAACIAVGASLADVQLGLRSEEHTSELQSREN